MDTDRSKLIEIRAYEIWEEEGRPEGREREHWAKASQELDAAKPKAEQVSTTPDTITRATEVEPQSPANATSLKKKRKASAEKHKTPVRT